MRLYWNYTIFPFSLSLQTLSYNFLLSFNFMILFSLIVILLCVFIYKYINTICSVHIILLHVLVNIMFCMYTFPRLFGMFFLNKDNLPHYQHSFLACSTLFRTQASNHFSTTYVSMSICIIFSVQAQSFLSFLILLILKKCFPYRAIFTLNL